MNASLLRRWLLLLLFGGGMVVKNVHVDYDESDGDWSSDLFDGKVTSRKDEEQEEADFVGRISALGTTEVSY